MSKSDDILHPHTCLQWLPSLPEIKTKLLPWSGSLTWPPNSHLPLCPRVCCSPPHSSHQPQWAPWGPWLFGLLCLDLPPCTSPWLTRLSFLGSLLKCHFTRKSHGWLWIEQQIPFLGSLVLYSSLLSLLSLLDILYCLPGWEGALGENGYMYMYG